MFSQFLSFSVIFFHCFSYSFFLSFIFFYFLFIFFLFSFIFFHFLSFSFIFFLSFSFIFQFLSISFNFCHAIALLADTWGVDLMSDPEVSAQLVSGGCTGVPRRMVFACSPITPVMGRSPSTVEGPGSADRMPCLWPSATLGQRPRMHDVFDSLISQNATRTVRITVQERPSPQTSKSKTCFVLFRRSATTGTCTSDALDIEGS